MCNIQKQIRDVSKGLITQLTNMQTRHELLEFSYNVGLIPL